MAVVPDILQSFIEQMNFSSAITSISGAVVSVEKVYHARKGSVILLDATSYTVASVDYALKQITVSANVTGSPAVYSIQAPKFFHGTPYATNAQFSKMKNTADKFPCIYLMEVMRQQKQPETSAYSTIPTLHLFFLDVANFADWSTDQHYEFCINAMENLEEEFIYQANRYKLFGFTGTYESRAHAKFGEFVDLKGHIQSILNEKLSGVETVVDIPIKRCCNC